ncbi:c-type cytochrome [Kaarinaea lacus]
MALKKLNSNQTKGLYVLMLLTVLIQACGSSGDDGGSGDPGGGETSSCLTDYSTTVNDNYPTADITEGGKLYDKWWVTAGVSEPVGDHPMWEDRAANTQNTTADSGTWRCKECHGWDYKGENGAYASGSHYTGFKGIDGAKNKQAATVFCAIWAGAGLGAGTDERHSFNTTTTGLSIDNVVAITRFITARGTDGLVDVDDYIDPVSKDIQGGNPTAGRTVFEASNGCRACHGDTGEDQMGGHQLGELASSNPWEVLHKVRYGQPGASMYSYIDDPRLTVQQLKDVLAYAQTLPGGGGGGTTTGNVARGGQLFDKWWIVTDPVQNEPTTVNPLFTIIQTANPGLNIQTPTTLSTTWRCKHCHGWDYAGKDGAYGSGSSNFTNVKGLLGAVNRSADQLRAIISDSQQGNHAWSNYLSEQDIEDLIAFIQNGIIDTEEYIARPTKLVRVYDQANGQYLYRDVPQGAFTGICATCHGLDGTAAPPSGSAVLLGPLALDNPWEVLHKTRFGQPGTAMPKLYNSNSLQDAVDILGYVQALGQ